MKQQELFISLKSKKIIDSLFQTGKYHHCPYFDVKYFVESENPSILPYSVLWAVSKKIGKAHQRNYIKRVGRSILFEILKENTIHRNLVFAFLPKKKFVHISYEKKKEALQKVLKQINALT